MSTRTTSRATKAVAALLVFALTQVLLGGAAARVSTPAKSPAAAPKSAGAPASGYLATRGNAAVKVDGIAARTGDTVFSGQQIWTPEGVGASVYLASLGRVDMAPGAGLTLTFGGSRLAARVAAGCVVLTPGKGVEGLLETKATSEKSDSAPIDMCVDAVDGVALKGAAADSGAGAVVRNQQDDDDKKKGGGADVPGGAGGGAGGGEGGLGTGMSLFLTAASVTTFALVSHNLISGPGCRRGRNFSPTLPRGPSSDCP